MIVAPQGAIGAAAQGPMAAEVAADMIDAGAFDVPVTASMSESEDGVIRTAMNVRPSMVQVQVGSEYGSGNIFSIDDKEVRIITAGHVVKNWTNADKHYAILFNGKVVPSSLEAVSDTVDAAVISIKTSDVDALDLISLRAIDIDLDNLKSFDEKRSPLLIALDSEHVINAEENQVYDYRGGGTGIGSKYVYGRTISSDIMVTDYGYKMIYASLKAHSGMSGGGVFDINGNYVGILVGGTSKKDMVAVRISDIMDLIHS